MPLTGPFGRVEALAKNMRDLASKNGKAQKAIGSATVPRIRKVWKEQFRTGVGPDGAWERNRNGGQPLDSRKLAADFKGKVMPGGVLFSSPVKWLMAHHRGHVFAARSVANRQNVMRFNAKGRLVKTKRFEKLKRGVAVFARAHRVGQRRLPARPLYPTRSIPVVWARAINEGAAEAMRRWLVQSTKRIP